MSESDVVVDDTPRDDRADEMTDEDAIPSRTRTDSEALDRAELEAFADRVVAENQRLHAEHARLRNASYRRPALALAGIGILALAFAALIPSQRTVLISLGGTGLFAGIVTYYLTPGTFVSAEMGEQLQATVAENRARLVEQLGLSWQRVYVPSDGPNAAMLFIPQYPFYEIPPQDALSQPLVTTGDKRMRGLSLIPMGDSLYRELERGTADVSGETAAGLVSLLDEAITETFELADHLTADLDVEDGRITFTVRETVWGDVGQIDHPVASLLAVSLAAGLDVPIELSVEQLDERGADARLVLEWDETLGESVNGGS